MQIETTTSGAFCWTELSTIGAAGAKDFYKSVFGWESRDTPMGDSVYTTMLVDNLPVAAAYEMMEEHRKQGIPPHWLLYVAVDSVADTTEQVSELGGKVIAGPMDVLPHGRMAVIGDPQGAVLALWEPLENQGAQLLNEPGAFSWAELATNDKDGARDFYVGLFDWGAKIDTADGYTQWINDKDFIGGMLELPAGDLPPHWKPYFRVDNCAASAARIRELGGALLHGPVEIPRVGPFAVVRDPQGALFAIIQLTNQ